MVVFYGDFVILIWDWSGLEYDDLFCVIEYVVYFFVVFSIIKRNCSDMFYILDISMYRG